MSYRKVDSDWISGRVGRALRGDSDAYTLAYYQMTAKENVKGLGLFWQPIGCVSVLFGIPLERLSEALAKLERLGFSYYDEEHEIHFVVESARHEWKEPPRGNANQLKGAQTTLGKQLDIARKSNLFNAWLDRYGETWGAQIKGLAKGKERLSQALRKRFEPPDPRSGNQEPEPPETRAHAREEVSHERTQIQRNEPGSSRSSQESQAPPEGPPGGETAPELAAPAAQAADGGSPAEGRGPRDGGAGGAEANHQDVSDAQQALATDSEPSPPGSIPGAVGGGPDGLPQPASTAGRPPARPAAPPGGGPGGSAPGLQPGGDPEPGGEAADVHDRLLGICSRTSFGAEDMQCLERRLATGQPAWELIATARHYRKRLQSQDVQRPILYLDKTAEQDGMGPWDAAAGFCRFQAAWPADRWSETPIVFKAWLGEREARAESMEEARRQANGSQPHDPILAGLAKHKASSRWRRGFVPNPEKWIRGHRWNDPPPKSADPSRPVEDGPAYTRWKPPEDTT